jgi:hypothetical protein
VLAATGRLDVLKPEWRRKLIDSGREQGLSKSYVSRMVSVLADALNHTRNRKVGRRRFLLQSVLDEWLHGLATWGSDSAA